MIPSHRLANKIERKSARDRWPLQHHSHSHTHARRTKFLSSPCRLDFNAITFISRTPRLARLSQKRISFELYNFLCLSPLNVNHVNHVPRCFRLNKFWWNFMFRWTVCECSAHAIVRCVCVPSNVQLCANWRAKLENMSSSKSQNKSAQFEKH